ncbi:MAG: carbamate kinase, partial [candidate division Zixibacteria bacterium]|nr:carbamate kinase [candidate division Zixibacteria bacterium]
KPTQRNLDRLTAFEVRRHLESGQFPAGSMGPKIEAAIQFLEGGGQTVIITSIEKAGEALDGKAGTRIMPS